MFACDLKKVCPKLKWVNKESIKKVGRATNFELLVLFFILRYNESLNYLNNRIQQTSQSLCAKLVAISYHLSANFLIFIIIHQPMNTELCVYFIIF